MGVPCAEAVEDSGVLELLVRLLDTAQQCLLAAGKDSQTPKYVYLLNYTVK